MTDMQLGSSTTQDEKQETSAETSAANLPKLEVVPTPTEHEPRVDGGRDAWLAVIGGCLVLFSTFGYTNAFGVYQDYYETLNVASPSAISWVGSVQVFLLVLMGLPAGRLLAAGYFRHTMVAGSALHVFSIFMLSLARTDRYYQILLAQGFGMGIGSGLLYMPVLTIQAHHWRKHRTLAMGAVMIGAATGAIVFSILLNQTLNSRIGFAWGVRASGFVVLASLGVACCITTAGTIPRQAAQTAPPTARKLLADVPFTLGLLGLLLALAGVFFPTFYIQVASITHGVDRTLAFYTVAILQAASIPGRVLPSIISPRIGVLNLQVLTCIACGGLTLVMLDIHNATSAVLLAVFFGFFSGSFFALIGPVVGALTRHPSEFGLRMALTFGITSLGTLVGPPVNGALVVGNHWFRPAVFSAMMFFGGSALLVASRILVAREKTTWRV